MNHLVEIRERFLREENSMKLGHLASDLTRIASLTEMKAGGKVLKSVLEEAKYFAEWAATAPGVVLETQMFLADIQGFIARKELEWEWGLDKQEWKEDFRHRTQIWSQELLERAGFLTSR